MANRTALLALTIVVLTTGAAYGALGELVFGPEMVTNGSFDTDLTGWFAAATHVPDDGIPGDPNGCGQISETGYLNQWVTGFIPGKTYRLRFSIRAVTQYVQYYPWVRFHDGIDGAQIESEFIYSQTATTTVFYQLPDGNLVDAQTTWATYEVDLIPGPNATALRLYFTPSGSPASDVRIDGISIKSMDMLGPELITNPNFDTDTTGWTAHLSSWIGADGAPDAGCVATDQNDAGAYLRQDVGIDPDKTYRFLYYFSSPDAGAGVKWAYPWVRFEDDLDATITSTFNYQGNPQTTGLYFVPDNSHLEARTNWQSHRLDVTPGTGATTFRIQYAVSDPAEFRFDSFSLREIDPVPDDCDEVTQLGFSITGDINTDCRVNLLDFAAVAADWLECIVPTDDNCSKPWL